MSSDGSSPQVTGKTSPFHQITLAGKASERILSGEETFFCFAYPTTINLSDLSLDRKEKMVVEAFFGVGGYLYVDRDLELVQAKAILSGTTGTGLGLLKPKKFLRGADK